MKKCFFRRALAGLLSFCLLASGLPALNLNLSASAEDGSGSTVDAFGISMHTFTEAERAAAEQSPPMGWAMGRRPLFSRRMSCSSRRGGMRAPATRRILI